MAGHGHTESSSLTRPDPSLLLNTIPLIMGNIIKVNGDYFVEFYGNGLRFRKKAGTSRAEAEAALKVIEDSLEVTAPEIPPGQATRAMFWERFREYVGQVCDLQTQRRFMAACDHCQTFLDSSRVTAPWMHEITPRVMEDYKHVLIEDNPGHPATINLTLYLIGEAFEFGRAREWLNDNPLRHINFVDEPRLRSPRVYTEVELNEFRQNLSESAEQVLTMMLHAGVSLKEARSLCWESVCLEERFMEVGSGHSERMIYRRIPLDVRLHDLLKDLRAKFPVAASVFDEPDPLLGINPWWVRNTFVRNALARGVSLTQLNRLLGVADIARVFRYRVFLPT